MVFKVVEIIGIPEHEISERRTSSGNSRQRSEARLTGNAEIKGSAGNVGLRVVVAPDFELQAQMVLMAPAQHRQARRKVILGVAVLNEALALCAHDVVGEIGDARR